jgi:hypothetical protein
MRRGQFLELAAATLAAEITGACAARMPRHGDTTMTSDSSKPHSSAAIRPFKIEIPQSDLDDLKARLARTRWTNELPAAAAESKAPRGPVPPGWEYGVPLDYVKRLVAYWCDRHDWRTWEARFYYEDKHAVHPNQPTTIPIGLASFAHDFRPLRRFAERDHKNIVSWNNYDRGGHWATQDAPDLLLGDIRKFFRDRRTPASR